MLYPAGLIKISAASVALQSFLKGLLPLQGVFGVALLAPPSGSLGVEPANVLINTLIHEVRLRPPSYEYNLPCLSGQRMLNCEYSHTQDPPVGGSHISFQRFQPLALCEHV